MVSKPSLTSMQSAVALVAGLTSIGGAAYSTVDYLRAAGQPGEIVAVVRESGSDHAVHGAVVEVRSPDDAIVTTMSEGDDGTARRAIEPGVYRVRVTHPKFADAAREVRVQAGKPSEVRVALEPRDGGAHASHANAAATTSAGRAIDHGDGDATVSCSHRALSLIRAYRPTPGQDPRQFARGVEWQDGVRRGLL